MIIHIINFLIILKNVMTINIKKEKNLGIDSIINYLKVYYDLINYYIDYIKGVRVDFDTNYFSSIYGETERLNNEYKEEVLRLKDELKESYDTNKLSSQDIEQYKSLLSVKDIELLNLDEQINYFKIK